jgi:hypothetical protein
MRNYTPRLARRDIRSSASNRAKRIKRLDIERVEVVQPQVEVPHSVSTAWGILINSAAKLGRSAGCNRRAFSTGITTAAGLPCLVINRRLASFGRLYDRRESGLCVA